MWNQWNRSSSMVGWLLTATFAACAPQPEGVTPSAILALAPTVGKADATVRADRGCQVVLREVSRQPGPAGFETQCDGGPCNYVWKGSIEMVETIQGATIHVLYRLAGDPNWWQVEAIGAATGQPGFVRREFRIHEHLFGDTMSAPDQAKARIELMPFIKLPDGTRIFDHNRRPGDLENYVLDAANSFAVGDDGTCPSHAARLSFFANYDEYVQGPLRQGEYLVLNYAIERLQTCRGTHNGCPAWDIVAYVKFAPGGQLVTGSVREFESNQGSCTNTAHAKDLAVKIPADATSASIWFQNYTGAGSSCQAWDSNYGANYRFDIWPPASDPRCKNLERWETQNSDMPYTSKPYCIDYTVAADLNADACEFYASGIGDGYMGHYGIPNNWIETYVTVPPLKSGKLRNVGMLTRYRNPKTQKTSEQVTFARPFCTNNAGRITCATNTWQSGFIYLRTGMMGITGFNYAVLQLAFFIDVEQAGGKVVRLWQSRHGQNYSWADAFTLPKSPVSIPYGTIMYANTGAALFDVQRTCAK